MSKIKNLILIAVFALLCCASEALGEAFPYAGDLSGGINGADDNRDSYIDLILPLAGKEDSFLFAAPRASMTGKEIFGSEANEFNLGFGYRKYFKSVWKDGVIAGINAYYDNRNSDTGHNYQQAGAGAEFLSEWFDARINGYIPFGNQEYFEGKLYDIPTQHHIAATYYYEVSMGGFDCEAGFKVPLPKFFGDLRVFGGYYYFTASKTDDVKGLKARAEYRPFNILRFNYAVYENKDFNGSDWQAGADISIPIDFRNVLRSKNPFKRLATRNVAVKDRMGEMVMRDMYVRVKYTGVPHPDELLSNERGAPYYFTVVSAGGNGDGTFEHPASLADGVLLNKAVTGDNANLLLLGGNYYQNATIDMSGHQADDFSMIGNAEVEYWGGYLGKLNTGNPVITFAPSITGVKADALSNAGNILISGIEFVGSGNTGTGLEISNYAKNEEMLIGNNSFTGFDKGVSVTDSTGAVHLYNNIVSGNNTGVEISGGSAYLEQNILENNLSQAVMLINTSGADIYSNLISNNALGVNVSSDNYSIIEYNEIAGNDGYGIYSAESYGTAFQGNYIYGGSAAGMRSSSDTAISIGSNNIYQNAGNGIEVFNSSGSLVSNNAVTENVNGIYVNGVNTASQFQNNQTFNNSASGILAENAQGSTFSLNTSSGNAADGMTFNNSSNNEISDNSAGANAVNGIFLNNCSGMTLLENDAAHNKTGILVSGGSGITVSTNTAELNESGIEAVNTSGLMMKYNNASSNSYCGIYAENTPDATFLSNFADYNSGLGGVYVKNSSNITMSSNETHYDDNSGITLENISGYSNVIYNGLFSGTNGHGMTIINSSVINLYWNTFIGDGSASGIYDLYLKNTTSFDPGTSGSNKFFNTVHSNYYGGDTNAVNNYINDVQPNGDAFY